MPPLCVVPTQKYIFCGADFGSTIALDLDLQTKVKLFRYSSLEQEKNLEHFLGIYSSFV